MPLPVTMHFPIPKAFSTVRRSYKYNGFGGTRDDNVELVGVVAQEIEKAIPFMVTSEKQKLRKEHKDVTDINTSTRARSPTCSSTR